MLPSLRKVRIWAFVRLFLGLAQASGSLATVLLLLWEGVGPVTLWSFGITTVFSLASIFLFRVVRVQDEAPRSMKPIKRYAAELIGTFALVFAGTGAIVINDVSGGAITHLGVAATFGLIVLAMIYALGDVSGAHLNPAVTVGFFAAGRFPGREVLPYVLSQTLGGLAASGTLHFLFPQHLTLGLTAPAGPAAQSFILEILLTALLTLVILSVSTGGKERGITAGIAIGAVVGLEALFAGPICGASMNPVRSLAPAVVSGQLGALWIYLAGPLLGALLAVPACACVRETGCCSMLPTHQTT